MTTAYERKYGSEPRYLCEGDEVYLPWNREKNTALRCKVVAAAGHHARIQNSQYRVDMWIRIEHLVVPPGSPREYRSVAEHNALIDQRNRRRFQERSARTLGRNHVDA